MDRATKLIAATAACGLALASCTGSSDTPPRPERTAAQTAPVVIHANGEAVSFSLSPENPRLSYRAAAPNAATATRIVHVEFRGAQGPSVTLIASRDPLRVLQAVRERDLNVEELPDVCMRHGDTTACDFRYAADGHASTAPWTVLVGTQAPSHLQGSVSLTFEK